MSQSRTKSVGLKTMALFASLLTAAPAITIPTAAEAQYYRGRVAQGAWRPGIVPRAAYRPAFGGYRPIPGFRQAYRPWRAPAYRAGYYPGARAAYRRAYYPYARPAFRRAYYPYARPLYRPAYYPAYSYGYGPRYGYGYGYGGYPYYGGYYRSYDSGGAVVAGLIGGLALGAIATAAARPAYRRVAQGNCFYERRRVVLRDGRAVVRRVRSCY